MFQRTGTGNKFCSQPERKCRKEVSDGARQICRRDVVLANAFEYRKRQKCVLGMRFYGINPRIIGFTTMSRIVDAD